MHYLASKPQNKMHSIQNNNEQSNTIIQSIHAPKPQRMKSGVDHVNRTLWYFGIYLKDT